MTPHKEHLTSKLIFAIYRLLLIIALPALAVYFIGRGLRDRRYWRRFGERLGFLDRSLHGTPAGAIWLHAVSVGEVISALGLLRRLRVEFPAAPLFVSSTTLAGRALAEEKLAGLADGVFYAPLDFPSAVRRVLRALKPDVVVVMETEIWPNLWRETARSGAGLVVVNARISDRTLDRYRRLRWFFRHVLVWPEALLVQSHQDEDRFLALGAPRERVRIAGNLKYDFGELPAAPEAVKSLLDATRPDAIWIAASTMPPRRSGDIDEDDAVIDAFLSLAARRPGLLLIVTPRRPERFDVAARKLEAAGTRYIRRAALGTRPPPELPAVLLVDTVGELASLFPVADVVFMGGTLAERGGHNILEPAFAGRAVIAGPHMENFAEIAEEFTGADALLRIGGAADLAPAVAQVLDDEALQRRLGAAARALAESKRGATTRVLRAIRHARENAVRIQPGPWLLAPMAWFWTVVSRRRQRTAARVRLSTPVISAGGIAMGGVGKTPFVLWLARRLRERGLRPAILTRGYRRRTPEACTVLEAGAEAPVAITGDEAQVLLRSGVAPLGICADRARAARIIEAQIRPDVFLLDDGFQHWGLDRDADVVLLDALDPLAAGAVFPRGRLREPPDALRRADVIVISRCEPGRSYAGIEALARKYGHAPAFLSRVRPIGWRSATSDGSRPAVPLTRAAAFCGLANPEAFWASLQETGVTAALRWTFPDHHRYRPAQLRRMARQARAGGAEGLCTTEKDLMNLPLRFEDSLGGLPLYWLEIGIEVERDEELLSLLLRQCRKTATA